MVQLASYFSAGTPARNAIIESTDPSVVSDRFSSEFAPHRLEVVSRPRRFHTLAHKVDISSSTVYWISSSADVQISTEPLRQSYIFYVPLKGRIRIERPGGGVEVVPGQIGIVNPDEPYRLHKHDACVQVTLKLPRAELVRQAEALLGHGLDGGLAFRTEVPVGQDRCPRFMRMLDMVCADLFAHRALIAGSTLGSAAEDLIVGCALAELPHTCSDLLACVGDRQPAAPVPYYIRRIERLVASDPKCALTMAQMVEVTGVSSRTLYDGFRKTRGISPMRYLKEVRLDGVRDELLAIAADAGARRTVTEVALDWGFNHLSDFAIAYRERFGERPSDTIRRPG